MNAAFATPDAPVGLSKSNGVLTLRRDRLDITQFTGNVGGGVVTASGGMTYQPKIQYAIGLEGSDMLLPTSVRNDLGMNPAMTGDSDGAIVQGQVNINQLSFTQDFDLSNLMAQFGGVASPPPAESFADNVSSTFRAFDVGPECGEPDGQHPSSANLRVIAALRPRHCGTCQPERWRVIMLGNRYIVDGGTIAFVNTTQTEPIVNRR